MRKINSHMITVERPLYEIDRFVQKRKHIVTKKPVFTEVSRTGFKDPHEMAHLISHPTTRRPTHYAVVLKTTFYNRNKNTNLPKLKQVAAHELAHIAVPHQHNDKFRHIAKRVGAGKYNDTGRG
jgi:predicted SprT family Zn-dependent metalloprotease